MDSESSVEKFLQDQADIESLTTPANKSEEIPLEKIPELRFRDVVIAKKFGSSPYEADR